eukprot:12908223-Alexandrium_andersonii.AAC.1
MGGEQGSAGSHYEPEPVGSGHHVAARPMAVAPPGLARSGELHARAYQNTGRGEGFLRRGTPSVGSGGSRENADHRCSDRMNEVSVDARSEFPAEPRSG